MITFTEILHRMEDFCVHLVSKKDLCKEALSKKAFVKRHLVIRQFVKRQFVKKTLGKKALRAKVSNRRNSFLSFGGPQLYNSEALPCITSVPQKMYQAH